MKRILTWLLIIITFLCSCKGTEEAISYEGSLSCKLTVKCDTVLGNIDKLNKDKAELIPENGILLENEEVLFEDGASVFDILTVACRKNKIIVNTKKNTGSGTVYIEGINNLIYGDCGELSGWMFFVNGKSAEEAADKLIVKDGDIIEWLYTCDMGNDL